MRNLSFLFLVILGLITQASSYCYTRYETLICYGEPLPLQGYDGHWSTLIFGNFNESSVISKNSFPGNTFENVQISGSLTLESIESGFLHGSENVLKQLTIIGNYELKNFDFADLQNFPNLQSLEFSWTGLELLPSGTIWPDSLREIRMEGNQYLQSIESHTFSHAYGLQLLHLSDGPLIHIKSNGLHSKSRLDKELKLSRYNDVIYDSNAFGNVDGGELWQNISIQTKDFNQEVFRLMLKTHFDKGHQSLFSINYGTALAKSCSSCDSAWLYKDAHKFGLDTYKNLIGQGNVVCPEGIGSILETTDPDFITLMESCPYPDMPWPDPTLCQIVTNPNQDTTVDPADCQCFYLCADQQIHGHECCQPGLVFNPDIQVCDFPFNVPNCQI